MNIQFVLVNSVVFLTLLAASLSEDDEADAFVRVVQDESFPVTMRANLYFGTTSMSQHSVANTGLMWCASEDCMNRDSIRHEAVDRDELAGWGWIRNDGERFGQQRLPDIHNGVLLETSFVQHDGTTSLEPQGWALRVNASAISNVSEERILSLFFYVSTPESHDFSISVPFVSPSVLKQGLSEDGLLRGRTAKRRGFAVAVSTEASGEASIPYDTLTHLTQSKPRNKKGREDGDGEALSPQMSNTHFAGLRLPDSDLWRVKDRVPELLTRSLGVSSKIRAKAEKERATLLAQGRPASAWLEAICDSPVTPLLSNEVESKTNIVILQRVLRVPFVIDFAFLPEDASRSLASAVVSSSGDADEVEVEEDAQMRLERSKGEFLGARLTALLQARSEAFDLRFQGFMRSAESAGVTAVSQDVLQAAQFGLSNLLGGLTFFRGSTRVRSGGGEIASAEGVLRTAVPSRSFFPRGFMWDEGFHQLIVAKWAPHVTRSVLHSWLARMDEDGWMEREQILGEESRSRVPSQFQLQDPQIANPPTLLLPLHALAMQFASATKGLSAEERQGHGEEFEFLLWAYSKFLKNYAWFKNTQRGLAGDHGSVAWHSFRWRGRTPGHCMASGLDDYPRPVPPTDHELHVDLVSWMTWYAERLRDIALILGEDASLLAQDAIEFHSVLEETHWDERNRVYADVGAIVARPGDTRYHLGHVVHIGYISVLPLLLELEPVESARVGDMLRVMGDDQHMFSRFGLRSLSKQDEKFGKEENYWRGAIWVNMNYLALKALRNTYGAIEGPHQKVSVELYARLRAALLENLSRQYRETGFLWESYDSETGRGRGCKPFTGWSSLITLIASEDYP